MARIPQGILGGAINKVGNVIGSVWKGIEYIRIMPASVANPRTPAQLEQRQRLTVLDAFLVPMSQFLRTGFRDYAIRMSGINAAFQYNIKNALTGTYPNIAVDYPVALVSRGQLPGALNQVAISVLSGTVAYSWDDNSSELGADSTDPTLIVISNPTKHQSINVDGLRTRSQTSQTVTVPDSWIGDLVQCYISFERADHMAISNSAFAGAVTVAT